jgi:hypothetical protein
MLPGFNERGDLPPGIHRAAWEEIDERFGAGQARQRLVGTLRHLYALAAQTGHLERFLIFGSFVTHKELPGDVDVVLVMAATFKLEEAPRESRALFSHAEADARFGASVFWLRRGILPEEEVADSWTSGKLDGTAKGGESWRLVHDQKRRRVENYPGASGGLGAAAPDAPAHRAPRGVDRAQLGVPTRDRTHAGGDP